MTGRPTRPKLLLAGWLLITAALSSPTFAKDEAQRWRIEAVQGLDDSSVASGTGMVPGASVRAQAT